MKVTLLPLFIALRFNTYSKQNKIISFISIISIIGTSLGIGILIIALSAINGFNKELYERILSIVPHANIKPINSLTFYNWINILNQIKKIPGITQATPYINFSGVIEKSNKFYPIQIYGINTLHDIHPNISSYLLSKHTCKQFFSNKQYIILGKGISDTTKIQNNEWINILIHNSNLHNNYLPYKKIQVKVINILNSKSYLDQYLALIPLQDAQNYLNYKENISGINIKVNNIFDVSKILNKIKNNIKNPIIIHNWMETYKYICQDIQTIRTLIYFTMSLVIIVTCFSIVSILTLIVKEKNRDIAILRTLGTTNYFIYGIFIWYSLLNSLTSIIIGGTIGILISLNLTKIYDAIKYFLKFDILHNDSYFINFLPSELPIKDILLIFTIEISISLIATLYPAIRIRNINPTKILK